MKTNKKFNNKIILIIEIVLAAIIIILSIPLIISLNNQVDYSQIITNTDGTDFVSTYDAKTDDNFTFRLANLECNEDCSNVSSIKIENQTLVLNTDYKVERGSIIVTIYKKILQKIKDGQHDIIITIKNGEKTINIGVKITITNSTADNDIPEQNDNEEPSDNEDENSTNTIHDADNNSTTQNPSNPTNNPNTSEPEPEPEPIPTHTAEFNLNNGYQVSYLGVHIYKADENQNPIYNDDGTYLDSFSYNKCDIQKDSVTIKTTYGTSNSRNISYEQWQSEIQAAEARGLIGQGGGWIKSLDEQCCELCGLSCDRW